MTVAVPEARVTEFRLTAKRRALDVSVWHSELDR